MASNYIDTNWQCNKGIIERNTYMLQRELATDATFRICTATEGKLEIIKAHRYMLISASPTFWTMFCGEMQETGDVVVSDVEPEAFREMLRFIYTEKPSLNGNNVMQILNAAKKYQLPRLAQKCVDFLHKQLNVNNACAILEHSTFFNEAELANRCMDIIEKRTAEAFTSKEFLEISRSTLQKVLENDKLGMPEIDIFERCYEWAKHKSDNLQSTAETLGNALYCIRFPTMLASDFTDKVCITDVLSEHDKFEILKYITSAKKDKQPFPYSCRPRKPYKVVRQFRVGETVRIRQDAPLSTYTTLHGLRRGLHVVLHSIGNDDVTVRVGQNNVRVPIAYIEFM